MTQLLLRTGSRGAPTTKMMMTDAEGFLFGADVIPSVTVFGLPQCPEPCSRVAIAVPLPEGHGITGCF